MSYLAVLTFDLHNADSEDYACADRQLAEVGLSKRLTADAGGVVQLPYNTYVGSFTGVSAGNVRDYVRERAKQALMACKLRGRLFVMAGGDWAWGSDSF